MSAAGRVLSVDRDRQRVEIDVDGRRHEVSAAVLVLEGVELAAGDWVVVHTGFAVAVLDESAVTELVDLRDAMKEVRDA